MARYIIRARIIPKGHEAFTVEAEAEALEKDAPKIEKVEVCEPCSYAEARTACYKFVAQLGHAIGKIGGEVADVVITDGAALSVTARTESR